jgi:hypothetical protein
MKKHIYLRYLAEFFLERQMFRKTVVVKNKTHFYVQQVFFPQIVLFMR